MPSNWLVFDRIRALAKRNRIYQAENNYRDEYDVDRLFSNATGNVADQASLLQNTAVHINRLERYKDYDQMDETGVMSLALDLYADEASLVDPERKHTLIIRARNRRLKRELEEFFFDTLLWDSNCRSAVRYLCKYGDMPFEIVPSHNRDSVTSLKFMNVYNFTRLETRHGDLVGFVYQDETEDPQFLHPWQVVHMRLTSYDNIFHPYGRAIIDGGRKSFKQLRLMEDAALIYRITRAPERRKFFIPVGMIPPQEVPQYLEMIARNYKRQRFYNPTTGTFDERYSPLVQEDDFLLPRRPDGSGPDIDTLPGAENLDQIADIEYFKKNMVAPTKIPFARVGIGENGGEASEKSLSQSHSEFAKAVQWVQRQVTVGLTKAAIVHLALRGYTVEDMKGFDIMMSATSAMEELYRIETWQTRVSVMAELKDLGWFPKEWIVTRFTDLSPDEIEELNDIQRQESEGGGGGGGGGGGMGGMGGLGGLGGLGGGEGEGEGEMPDLGEGGGEESAPGGEEPAGLPEGFDVNAAKKLISEMEDVEKKDKLRALLNEWADNLGKSDRETHSTNHFQNMLNSNELDGLTTEAYDSSKKDAKVGVSGYYNPNNSDGILVEWSTADEADDVMSETMSVLCDDFDDLDEDIDITDEDLPN